MEDTYKKGEANKKGNWAYPIIIFVISQCIFIFFELISWTPNFRDGALFQKIYETELFTQWFSPYSTPQLNLFTAVFMVALLPPAIIGAIKNLSLRKQ